MPDFEITCTECGTAFPFTEREQDYYRERGLSHPKRCKPCRDARRANFGGARQGGGGGADVCIRSSIKPRYCSLVSTYASSLLLRSFDKSLQKPLPCLIHSSRQVSTRALRLSVARVGRGSRIKSKSVF